MHFQNSRLAKPKFLLLLIAAGALSFPYRALADAGTPLMWAGLLHLSIGNAVIGIAEGVLLSWLFSTSKARSIWVMIIANYASAWGGGVFIDHVIVEKVPMDLTNAWMWFWILVGLTYCMTLVIEWPFIVVCLWGKEKWFPRSLKASLVVQSASYLVIFGWYWMASGTSLYTKMNVVAASDLSLPKSVLVYFVSTNGCNVYSRHLQSDDAQFVCKLNSTNTDRLFFRQNVADTNLWDLVARVETDDHRKPECQTVRTNLATEQVPQWQAGFSYLSDDRETWFSFGEARWLGSTNGQWTFSSGFWPIEGLRAKNTQNHQLVRFSYETPFGAWIVRNVVRLPDDKALFQLGNDQICVFDPETRKVALLWHGRGPAPVLENADAETRRTP